MSLERESSRSQDEEKAADKHTEHSPANRKKKKKEVTMLQTFPSKKPVKNKGRNDNEINQCTFFYLAGGRIV